MIWNPQRNKKRLSTFKVCMVCSYLYGKAVMCYGCYRSFFLCLTKFFISLNFQDFWILQKCPGMADRSFYLAIIGLILATVGQVNSRLWVQVFSKPVHSIDNATNYAHKNFKTKAMLSKVLPYIGNTNQNYKILIWL